MTGPLLDRWTAELRRHARVFSSLWGPFPFGWLFLGMCLLVVCLALLGSWQEQRVQRTEERLALAAKTPTPSTRSTDEHPLRDFQDLLFPHEHIPQVIEEMLEMAAQRGLSIPRGEYNAQPDRGAGFLRYRMNLPLQGSAAAVHDYIETVLHRYQAVALQSVQYQREQIESDILQVRTQWLLLARLPSATPLQTRAP